MIALSLIPAEIAGIWGFVLVGSLAALIAGAGKAGFGGNIGPLAMPIMVMACGKATIAAGVMLPLLIACDYFALICWWDKWDRKSVSLLLPGLIVGTGLGWLALWALLKPDFLLDKDQADAYLMLGIGLIALLFVCLQVIRRFKSESKATPEAPWYAPAMGTAAGLTSTLSHAAGPIVAMYMLNRKLPKDRYVASTVLFYWIGNQIKLLPYFWLSLINTSSAGGSLVLLPAVVGGAALGVFLNRRIGQKQFTSIIYVLLVIAGATLIYKALDILHS